MNHFNFTLEKFLVTVKYYGKERIGKWVYELLDILCMSLLTYSWRYFFITSNLLNDHLWNEQRTGFIVDQPFVQQLIVPQW